MRFGVDPEALVRDSGHYAEAGRALDRLDVPGALAPLQRAFPGGLTAATIRELGSAWADRLLRARLGLHGVQADLAGAGEAYAEVEQVATRALSGHGDLS
ncbi:hypothetical protein [Intrasporangium sp. DVR]|uniref:hypothetical protein n=1 Tax=Intrasporangium sp. DVR TaxID=3127867 RepID=UPI00313A680A